MSSLASPQDFSQTASASSASSFSLAAFLSKSILAAKQALLPASYSAPLTRAQESEKLREYAFSIRAREPGFADDLFAAADRHEWPESVDQ